jgi:hypothetical protein
LFTEIILSASLEKQYNEALQFSLVIATPSSEQSGSELIPLTTLEVNY